MKRKLHEKNTNHYVYGWCVMASDQPATNNRIIIYTDSKKPKRGNNGWSEYDGIIYYGLTDDKTLIEGRTPSSTPILVKMKVEIA